jgi:hypothetical protein
MADPGAIQWGWFLFGFLCGVLFLGVMMEPWKGDE